MRRWSWFVVVAMVVGVCAWLWWPERVAPGAAVERVDAVVVGAVESAGASAEGSDVPSSGMQRSPVSTDARPTTVADVVAQGFTITVLQADGEPAAGVPLQARYREVNAYRGLEDVVQDLGSTLQDGRRVVECQWLHKVAPFRGEPRVVIAVADPALDVDCDVSLQDLAAGVSLQLPPLGSVLVTIRDELQSKRFAGRTCWLRSRDGTYSQSAAFDERNIAAFHSVPPGKDWVADVEDEEGRGDVQPVLFAGPRAHRSQVVAELIVPARPRLSGSLRFEGRLCERSEFSYGFDATVVGVELTDADGAFEIVLPAEPAVRSSRELWFYSFGRHHSGFAKIPFEFQTRVQHALGVIDLQDDMPDPPEMRELEPVEVLEAAQLGGCELRLHLSSPELGGMLSPRLDDKGADVSDGTEGDTWVWRWSNVRPGTCMLVVDGVAGPQPLHREVVAVTAGEVARIELPAASTTGLGIVVVRHPQPRGVGHGLYGWKPRAEVWAECAGKRWEGRRIDDHRVLFASRHALDIHVQVPGWRDGFFPGVSGDLDAVLPPGIAVDLIGEGAEHRQVDLVSTEGERIAVRGLRHRDGYSFVLSRPGDYAVIAYRTGVNTGSRFQLTTEPAKVQVGESGGTFQFRVR